MSAALRKNAAVTRGKPKEADVAASAIIRPGFRHAVVASSFGSTYFTQEHIPLAPSWAVLADEMKRARDGDLGSASELLTAQALTLDSLFTELARRAGQNMGEHTEAADRYMRLALKAQSNCRATIEALAKLHQPREQTVRHVHVNQGGQAIVADHFHQQSRGAANGISDKQSHATASIGAVAALPGPNSEGPDVQGTSRPRKEKVPHARRDQPRRP